MKTLAVEGRMQFNSAPLSRQAHESVRIFKRNKEELLNSTNEFNHPPIA